MKVEIVRKKLDEIKSPAYLEVDGGISAETLPRMKDAGANVFVAGNAIFKHPQGTEAGIKALRACL
jgi:ribulose-phosphate 3-epimerase